MRASSLAAAKWGDKHSLTVFVIHSLTVRSTANALAYHQRPGRHAHRGLATSRKEVKRSTTPRRLPWLAPDRAVGVALVV